MGDYSLRLDAICLASKWGFNDGDMPDDMPSCVDYNLWRNHTLPALVRQHLLPKLEGVNAYQLGTCHNPIRTDDLSGHDDVFVEVGLEDILAAQRTKPMTAEQLEELLGHTGSADDHLHFGAAEVLKALAPSLARRVLAAENLVAELEIILENDDDHWSMFKCALTAYRESSK